MNIIIAGISRSGKTTIAKNLSRKHNLNYIPFDSIISTLENLYPDLGINHSDDNVEFSPVLARFMKEFLSHIDYEDIHTVIDLYQLFPKDYLLFQNPNTQIVYLGYTEITPEEKLAHIKRHCRDKDWTNDVEDGEMLEILKLWIAESRIMKEQCAQFDIDFVDTSYDFKQKLIEAELCMERTIETVNFLV